MRRPRKTLALITSLATLLALTFVLTAAALHLTSAAPPFLALLGFPAVFILAATSWWLWSIYRKSHNLYRRWVKAERSVAQIVLDLDSFDVTYHTIPQPMRAPQLTHTWESLNSLALALLKHQETINQLEITSHRFAEELTEYEKGVERLTELAQALMGSGSFWSAPASTQHVLDVLLRPYTRLVREQLFFLEDTPGKNLDPAWGAPLREAYGQLVALTHQKTSSEPTPPTHQELRELISAWQGAEASLDQAARQLNRKLAGIPLPLGAIAPSAPSHRSKPSQSVLRQTLGLPHASGQGPEYQLLRTTAATYPLTSQDWRPPEVRPGTTLRPSLFTALAAHRTYARAKIDNPLARKAHVFFARLDSLILDEHPPAETGASQRRLINIGITGGTVLGLYLLWQLVKALDFSNSSFSLLTALLAVPSSFLIGFSLIFTPAALLALRMRWIDRIRRGDILSPRLSQARIKTLQQRLDRLMLTIDESELDRLMLSPADTNMLSSRIYHHTLALAHRDLAVLQDLRSTERSGAYGSQLMDEADSLIAYLEEDQEDLASFRRTTP